MNSKLIALGAAFAVAVAMPSWSVAADHKHEHKDDHKDHDHKEHDHEGHDHKEHDHEGHDHGDLLEVGDHVAFLDVDHNEKAGTVVVSVFGGDAKTPLKIADAPRINLMSHGKRAQIKTSAVGSDKTASKFSAKSDHLKGHLHGKIRIKIKGKSYQVDLPDDHH